MYSNFNFPNAVARRDELFDRDIELSEIQQTLQSGARRPVVIIGERVIGKSSLLAVVAEWARQEHAMVAVPLPHVYSRHQLMEEILDAVAGTLGSSLYQLGLRDNQGQLLLSTVNEFKRVFHALTSQQPNKQQFLLIVDELDTMLAKCDDATADQILDFIGFMIEHTMLPIKFICSMTKMPTRIQYSRGSPFVNISRIVKLTPWDREASRDFVEWLIEGRFAFDEDSHRALFEAGGGHPFFTKAILYTLLNHYGKTLLGRLVTLQHVRPVVDMCICLQEVVFTTSNLIGQHFSEWELKLLRQIAQKPEGMSIIDISGLG